MEHRKKSELRGTSKMLSLSTLIYHRLQGDMIELYKTITNRSQWGYWGNLKI